MRIVPILILLLCQSAHAAQTVNDISGMNPIEVAQVLAPTELEQVVDAVRGHPGPIAIGGGRFSMGGQTATEHALQVDMRRFNRVVEFSAERREIRVQTGITWREVLDYIDPHGLSPQIMQSYANFTVGGALSVNAHGRYVGQGPLVLGVRSLRLVLADGQVVEASPTHNSELFYGAIGGYGGLGVIVEATLPLVENSKLVRQTQLMPLSEYAQFFATQVRGNPDMVMHNGILYTDDYDSVRAVSYLRTDAPLTVAERLVPNDRDYKAKRAALAVASSKGGAKMRENLVDPLLLNSPQVQWRNHEASLDVRELQPISGSDYSYVLQEYFVPEAQLQRFVVGMKDVLKQHKVKIANISIRHAKADPGTLLAWARGDTFALVLYYRQGVSPSERAIVTDWTRQLIDLVIAHQGSYYLPYQIHASREQFLAAYPRAKEFFALKKRVDPTNKFRNKLWDAYYRQAE
ncbi:FAD-binding oxidoreductase [Pseudomonas anguilliseptica]|uniref:FAD/FMN-containing dehydrogenase n=1 Tax=Pseudomonas anguilliseptica TaxID=53406 RepID=A0A1H5BY41_PSEAG|nr:FAD-binding oxidoreductase [Pseudomonas anguilliseptica]SED59306.1 FAD/FMN-containing dehydrogenase [Pseudomonas anguilliseptica]